MANSSLKRLQCAYDFDLFKFLYAFSREDGDLKEFAKVICLWPLRGGGNLREGIADKTGGAGGCGTDARSLSSLGLPEDLPQGRFRGDTSRQP